MDSPSVGDLIEYSSARGGRFRGLVISVVKSVEDLIGTEYEGLKFTPWPTYDPLFILVDDTLVFWCGDGEDIKIHSQLSTAIG